MTDQNVTPKYLTYTQAEVYTSLSRVTLWRAVKKGQLQSCGYGKAVRFTVEELDKFMQAACK